jgi:hypothetical protein
MTALLFALKGFLLIWATVCLVPAVHAGVMLWRDARDRRREAEAERQRHADIVARYDRGEIAEVLPDELERDHIYALYLAGRLCRIADEPGWLADCDDIVRPMSVPVDMDRIICEAGL